METVSYGQFSQAMHARVLAEHRPLNATIEVTRRCPLSCQHCYNNLPMGDQAAREAELTYSEHCRLLDEMADAGCLWLLYTGGEILARRDFLDIYTHAKRRGFLITLFTNGTLITPAVADYLQAWRPFAIEITLYGYTRATYEGLTGIPGSHARCLRGIELLLERGLPLRLKTVAVTLNRHEVGDMRRFAERLGVEFKFDAMMNPRIDCSRSPLDVRLSAEECVELDLEDPKRMAEWDRFAREYLGPVHRPEDADQLYHCGGGVNAFAIDPYGRMSICVLSQRDLYDVRSGSFREGWEHFLRRVRSRKLTRLTKCVTCELKSLCGMCPANGELENGDPEAPVDFLCRVAHLRALTFGFPVAPHGDCEYCESGTGHQALLASAATLERSVSSGTLPARVALPLHAATDGAPPEAGGCHGPDGCRSCGARPPVTPA